MKDLLNQFKTDKMEVKIFSSRDSMGIRAAEEIADKVDDLLNKKNEIRMIFAAAPSQNEMLAGLRKHQDIDWSRVIAFHMDEYIGIDPDAPQAFGQFLRERLFDELPFKEIHYIDPQAEDPEKEAARYEELLNKYPVDICCMGIGENGHIAFNDPHIADFNDPQLVKIVELDEVSRQQQVNDGCFASLDAVPETAITLTIPALTNADHCFIVVPADSKQNAVYNTIKGPVNTDCPATILRKHDNAILYLDRDSAGKLDLT